MTSLSRSAARSGRPTLNASRYADGWESTRTYAQGDSR